MRQDYWHVRGNLIPYLKFVANSMDQLVILLPESGCLPFDQADISGDTGPG